MTTGRLALEAAGIAGTWDVAQVALPAPIDAVLGWAVREAVTNVIRHSRARTCVVRVTAGLAEVALEVVDDGVGHDGQRPKGNGLAGLAERLAALGGRLHVTPDARGGFRLRATVPTPASLAGAPR